MFPSSKELALLINKYCTERGEGVYSLENHDYNKPETKLGVAQALDPEKKAIMEQIRPISALKHTVLRGMDSSLRMRTLISPGEWERLSPGAVPC